MSLQHAAKHLAAHGRGKDTELIHMDKGEIASLQKLALANGGSLTINPQTGLPEAGFLSAILPMVAGAGLMMIPGMQASAAGLIVGGLQTARTGSLSKGIMAGLGAYGGAGMANSFGTAGASSAAPTTVSTPIAPPPAPVIPEGVPNFGPSASADAFSVMPTTPAITPSAGLPTAYQDYGPVGEYTASSARLPTGNGGITVTAPTPTVQAAAPVSEQGIVRAIDNSTIPKDFNAMNASERFNAMKQGASFENAGKFITNNKYTTAGTAASIASGMQKDPTMSQPDKDMGQRYSYSPGTANPIPEPDVPTYEDMLTQQGNYGRQQKYFSPAYTPISNTAAKDLYNYANGGTVEQMSNNAAMGANTMYPMANMATSSFATPYQAPQSTNMLANMVAPSGGGAVGAMSGEPNMQGTRMAMGGLSDLGGYSDGGRLLRGPGDGVSDSIPAVIGKKQPARLADGEFVVPARIVSELGNGSTEAGARKLYAMMDRVQASRKNTVGKGKVAKNNRADKYLPA